MKTLPPILGLRRPKVDVTRRSELTGSGNTERLLLVPKRFTTSNRDIQLMIEIEAALQLIIENTQPLTTKRVPFHLSLFQVLAEDVPSDTDSPPFEKSMMDGYAVRAEDVGENETSLLLVGTLTAGEQPQGELPPGKCIRIMTGAIVPPGADAVVPREQTDDPPSMTGDSGSSGDAGSVTFRSGKLSAGANILKRGTCMTNGQIVLKKGTLIQSAQLGLLAEIGHLQVLIHKPPTAAVVATGNELVTVDQKPALGQLRNTNGPMIATMLRAARAEAVNFGIAPDDEKQLKQIIQKGLHHDLLVLTGGVSAGDLDLVPKILKESGVEQIFHGVRLKPGKPVWFGRTPQGKIVFGLPGNPVSSYVCCQLLVRVAVARLRGMQTDAYSPQTGVLQHNFEVTGNRRTFWPGRFERQGDLLTVQLLPWKGSADLLTWAQANCMVDLPAPQSLTASTQVKFIELDI